MSMKSCDVVLGMRGRDFAQGGDLAVLQGGKELPRVEDDKYLQPRRPSSGQGAWAVDFWQDTKGWGSSFKDGL